MKDIKTFLIGFLSCACIMLFMGQTFQKADDELTFNINDEIGRYQGFGTSTKVYMLDTTDGQLYDLYRETGRQIPYKAYERDIWLKYPKALAY